MVLQLFLEHGEFWEKVRDMRSRWKIIPATRLPPDVRWPLNYLDTSEHYPRCDLGSSPKLALYPRDPDGMEIPEQNRWEWELDQIAVETVPQYSHASEWRLFISACVLYNPPELELVRFAEYGRAIPDVVGLRDGQAFEMLASPVRRMPYPEHATDPWRWFYEAMLREIGERYLKPQGLDIQKMFREVLRDSNLREELHQRLAELPHRWFIEVEEHTTSKDVERAFKIIAAEQERPPPLGRPSRNRLIAIECALLYDKYNPRDPAKKSRRKWTHEKLAKRYGLDSKRAAKEYIADGQELIKKKGDI